MLEMIGFGILFLTLTISSVTEARPPQKKGYNPNGPIVESDRKAGNGAPDWDLGVDYNKYLQEVVQVLESDPDFR